MKETVEKKSKWGKVGKVALILSVILLVIFAAGYAVTGIPAGAATNKRTQEEAAKMGLFTTEAEVLAFNRVPDNENADSILATLKCPDLGYGDEIPKKIKEKMPLIQAALPALEKACQKKYLVGKRNFLQSSGGSQANALAWGASLVKLATVSSERNNFEETERYLRLATNLAMKSDDDHSSIGNWNRNSIAGRIHDLLRKLIPVHSRDPRWLVFFSSTLKQLDQPYDFISTMKVEHFYASNTPLRIAENRYPREEFMGDGLDSLPEIRFGRMLPRFAQANQARISQYFIAVYPKLPKDPYDFEGLSHAQNSAAWMFDEVNWSYSFLRFVAGNEVSARIVRANVTRRNALLQAVTLLKEHSDPAKGLPLRGRYRTDLDDSPFRIKKLPKGWILYSVGSDRVDDGGDDSTTRAKDWVIHLSPGTVPIVPKPKVTPSVPLGSPAGSPGSEYSK